MNQTALRKSLMIIESPLKKSKKIIRRKRKLNPQSVRDSARVIFKAHRVDRMKIWQLSDLIEEYLGAQLRNDLLLSCLLTKGTHFLFEADTQTLFLTH